MAQPPYGQGGSSTPTPSTPPTPGTPPPAGTTAYGQGGSSAPIGSTGPTDNTPPAEPLHGAHDTYEKGEIGSIGALVSDIATDMSTLMRQELALAKAEAKQSATRAGKGVGMLGGAGVAAHLFLIFGSLFVMFVLADLFDSFIWAALVVALLWAIIAAVLALVGRSQLKKVDGLPKTTETVKAVPNAIKGNEDMA